MKRGLGYVLVSWWLAGCGLLGESEAPAPQVKAELTQAVTCDFPAREELEKDRVTVRAVNLTVDCLEKQMDAAFDRVRGEKPGELSVRELRAVYRRGLVKDLSPEVRRLLDEDDFWEVAGQAFGLLHPQGRPAISQAVLKRFLSWARKHGDLYVRFAKIKWNDRDQQWLYATETIRAVEELFDFLSPEFRLTFPEGQRTAVRTAELLRKHAEYRYDRAKLLSSVEALWIAKSFFLEDKAGQGVWSDLRGDSIRELIGVLMASAREADLTFGWGIERLFPDKLPPALPEEWKQIAALWTRYFSEKRFAVIETKQVGYVLEKLMPDSRLDELAADLVRIGQRLSPRDRIQPGLHPVSLSRLLAQAETIARDLKASAPIFESCARLSQCRITVRRALSHPVLRRVALKGGFEWWRHRENPRIKRLDTTLGWESLTSRLFQRGLVTKVFEAFDLDGNGIPLDGKTTEDLNETFDLAFTFLRFIAIDGGGERDERKSREQRVPNFILVKPGPLYKVMGLIGDRWMTDGNDDGILDAEEFFSIVKVYETIHESGNQMLWEMSHDNRYVPVSVSQENRYRETVFARGQFVRDLRGAFRESYPYMHSALADLREDAAHSLFHALVGNSVQRPLDVVGTWGTSAPKTLRYYVKPDAAIAPAALISLLDRLMIRCDGNEDERLDWRELDCAVPLILEGAAQTIASSLIEIDAGPHDAARLLLTFLRAPGVPRTLAKLLVVNGSIREFRLDGEFKDIAAWADSELSVNWDDLSRFIGAPEGSPAEFWRVEAERRYGHCDTSPKDGRLKGRAELECFVNEVLRQIELSLVRLVGSGVTTEGLERFREWRDSPVIRLAVKLATSVEQDPEIVLTRAPLYGRPSKILGLLEEIIRRSVPVWQMRD